MDSTIKLLSNDDLNYKKCTEKEEVLMEDSEEAKEAKVMEEEEVETKVEEGKEVKMELVVEERVALEVLVVEKEAETEAEDMVVEREVVDLEED
jgi:hypothetical protein